MQQLLQVSVAIVLAQCVALAAAPVRAANGVVLVGCNLLSKGGPTVTFVQGDEVSDTDEALERRRFVGISGLRSEDLTERDCAEVLSGLTDDGLAFQAMEVFGKGSSQALWFFQRD